MLVRLRDDERGVAMIVALLVSFVVLLLSIYVVNLSIHASTSSAYDRNRVQSVNSAEAGVNAFWSMMQNTPPEELPCPAPTSGRLDPVTGTLSVEPGVTDYGVQATYFNALGQPVACTDLGQKNPPAAVLVTSTGTTNEGVPRTLQAYMQLKEVRGGGFEAAIIADQDLNISGNVAVDGPYLINANIYVNNGNLTLGGNLIVKGNIYVHNGSAAIGGSTSVTGDVWSWAQATLDSPATIGVNLQSSSSYLGVASGTGGTVGGCATAGTTVSSKLDVKGLTADGTPCIQPNSATTVHPPDQPLPKVCWESTANGCEAIDEDGFTTVPATSCLAALTYLRTADPSTPTILRVTNCPNLSFQANDIKKSDIYKFGAKLIIVNDGGFTMLNRSDWCGFDTCSDTGQRLDLEFVVNANAVTTCTGGTNDISINNNTNFWNSKVILYTPCTINASNNGKLEPQTAFDGQILGGNVNVSNKFAMRFDPILIPGVSPIAGFEQDVVFLREVASGS
ncbi:MAG TPA: hypothetical protein VF984_03880 [Actinomycetota bacterium]